MNLINKARATYKFRLENPNVEVSERYIKVVNLVGKDTETFGISSCSAVSLLENADSKVNQKEEKKKNRKRSSVSSSLAKKIR